MWGFFSDLSHEIINQLDKSLNKRLSSSLKERLMPTKLGDITPIYPLGQIESKKVYIVGLGQSSQFTVEKCRQTFGKIAKSVKDDVTILLETFDCKEVSINELAMICSEAITLATYKMKTYKTEQKSTEPNNFFIHCDTEIQKI